MVVKILCKKSAHSTVLQPQDLQLPTGSVNIPCVPMFAGVGSVCLSLFLGRSSSTSPAASWSPSVVSLGGCAGALAFSANSSFTDSSRLRQTSPYLYLWLPSPLKPTTGELKSLDLLTEGRPTGEDERTGPSSLSSVSHKPFIRSWSAVLSRD